MDYTEAPGKYHDSFSNKEWYAQRNKQILADKQAGMSNKDLVKKYNVSPARIQYLIKTERSRCQKQ